MNQAMESRGLACALLVALALLPPPSSAGERKLSPKRKELSAAVEEYHGLMRRRERAGGYTDRELLDLKEEIRTAKRRVHTLKEEIVKEERQPDDYYDEDPYPQHRKDPNTGGEYRLKLPGENFK